LWEQSEVIRNERESKLAADAEHLEELKKFN
jgi:hypothetical protein